MITIRGELHSSKNSRQIVRTGKKVRIVKSDASKADESLFAGQLLEQREKWREMLEKYANDEGPLFLYFEIRRKTKARFDYVNIIQGLCDAMVEAGYIEDDDADHILPNFFRYKVDKNNPGCDIWIEL